MSEMRLAAGDQAEYVGPIKRLVGTRVVIDSLTQKRTRARCIVRIAPGRWVMRRFKPQNLRRLGGGVLDDQDSR